VKLVIQDDRNLVLYAADGPAWSTKTETASPPPPAPVAEPAAEDLDDKGVSQEPEPAENAVQEPAAEPPPVEPAPQPAARTHTVEPGDTLWAIAERFYGDGNKYQVIADASGVPNPDLIYPGQVLTIP
jgi:nucleoid-associated protein YgaU